MEMIFATGVARESCPSVGIAAPGGAPVREVTGTRLEISEIVGLRDLVDLGGLFPLVDGDGELLDLVFEPTLPRRHFNRHAPEESGKIAQGVGPLHDLVKALGGELPRLDGERRSSDSGDAAQICEIELAGTLLRQACTNARAKHHWIVGFGEIVVGAESKTPRDTLSVVHCRNH